MCDAEDWCELIITKTFAKTSKEVKMAAALGTASILLFATMGVILFLQAVEVLPSKAEEEEGGDLTWAQVLAFLGFVLHLRVFLAIRDDADSEPEGLQLMKHRAKTYVKTFAPLDLSIPIAGLVTVWHGYVKIVAVLWLLRLPSLWRMYRGQAVTVPYTDYAPPEASPAPEASEPPSPVIVEASLVQVVQADARVGEPRAVQAQFGAPGPVPPTVVGSADH
mmetsp:Transcript_92677/g.207507  ORF Transcript_92677/g.207507 Transcript_92677/m.207507 type:complete len:221 (-) Transcript_92677:38-700(-)